MRSTSTPAVADHAQLLSGANTAAEDQPRRVDRNRTDSAVGERDRLRGGCGIRPGQHHTSARGTRWVEILVALAAGANTLADRVATGYTRGATMLATALLAALVLIAHPRSLPAAPPAPRRGRTSLWVQPPATPADRC
jgi:hypothetical protein